MTISQKLKIVKWIFHSFQNIVQLFGSKNENGSFWGGRGLCMSLTRTGPTFTYLMKKKQDCFQEYVVIIVRYGESVVWYDARLGQHNMVVTLCLMCHNGTWHSTHTYPLCDSLYIFLDFLAIFVFLPMNNSNQAQKCSLS